MYSLAVICFLEDKELDIYLDFKENPILETHVTALQNA